MKQVKEKLMRPNDLDPQAPLRIPGVPQTILDDVLAGMDDVKHRRSVQGDVVLAEIDTKVAGWLARNDGGSYGTTADR